MEEVFSQITIRVLIPLGALLIGWVIGFFDSNNRTNKKIQAAENKAEAAVREARDKIAEAEARLALFSQPAPGEPGLLRLSNESGNLALELDGARVDTPLSPEQRKRLIDLLSLIRPWLEGSAAQAAAARPAAPVQTPPAPVSAVSTILPPQPLPVKPEGAKPKMPPLSIVGQIDSILQLRMMNTPLASRDIRLVESHEGGVEVFVGTRKYASVEDVPDEDVKSAIRAAIAEWEKKYTPGL
jgi:hypothetical protein